MIYFLLLQPEPDEDFSMLNTPVSIIGCGPIGLAGALLLSKMGVKSLVIERRSEINPHPRSRFVDTNTMELMRAIDIEKAVERTGLHKSWTEYNRWLASVCGRELAAIPSPTFLTAPRSSSPCLPVMTCQDYVEQELTKAALVDTNIDLRFETEAFDLRQDADGAYLKLKDLNTGSIAGVSAQYIVGADGPRSMTREMIGAVLETDPRPVNSQDVIFDADLSRWINKRKGSLIYVAPAQGVVVFQPLDGKRRWRCQVVIPTPDLISEANIKTRIQAAIGTDENIPIEIKSMNVWRPTPGSTNIFSQGRIFIAGDAAHISVPTGGMGNNTGFAGIRNLTWKMALVLNGVFKPEILASYEVEHKPIALERIAAGVDTFEKMIKIFQAYFQGGDIDKAARGTRQYADYDGLLLGFELSSDYIAKESVPGPEVENKIIEYVPCIRSGRRAPHIWLDKAQQRSVLDLVGNQYALVLGREVSEADWTAPVSTLRKLGLPISLVRLPANADTSPYGDDEVVLIRPDSVISDRWRGDSITPDERLARLHRYMPLTKEPHCTA